MRQMENARTTGRHSALSFRGGLIVGVPLQLIIESKDLSWMVDGTANTRVSAHPFGLIGRFFSTPTVNPLCWEFLPILCPKIRATIRANASFWHMRWAAFGQRSIRNWFTVVAQKDERHVTASCRRQGSWWCCLTTTSRP